MPSRNREKLQQEREKRDRLAYIGTLAAGLVHEVRTPLNAIQLNAQLLEEDVDKLSPDLKKKFNRRINRVTGQISEVVKTLDEFLAFARPPRMDSVPTDLNHFLREVLEFSTPEFDEKKITIESSLADDMYPVIMDKAQFTHVMLNIFRNACESCELAEDKKHWVKVNTLEEENDIIIQIDDNGIGIEPDAEEKIFELFYSTKEHGTGLGLGIVRRIVEEHGGKIQAEDLPEAGARFTIVLPRGKFLEFKEE
ncbi:MAG: sensor histidine kinase [Planctomycetota bacterium]|jgi:signal transduction histidine kinase